MTGTSISHYRILEKLGEGGMGIVYKAEDTRLHRAVALKFLPPELTRDQEAKQRFILEAQAASSLDHNNIGVIHEIDTTIDGQLFICMNYYEGETLKDKIQSGKLTPNEVIDITLQIAAGLKKAHENGIIHRDIKPANIFITREGIVKILDFGLAKLADRTQITKIGATIGTIAYMSPEQATGEIIDYKTDIWSLGVVLYEMITGEQPFRGDFEQAVIYSILNDSPSDISDYRDDLHPAVQGILKKMLGKNPEERYDSANDIIKDLEYIREDSHEDIKSRRFRGKRHLKRKLLFAVAAVSAIAIICTLIYLLDKNEGTAGGGFSSVGIMYLKNLGGPDDEYFSYGLTEDLIIDLSKVGSIRVPPLNDILSYRESGKTLTEVSKELDVKYILTGSLHRETDELKIRIQLVDPIESRNLWTDRWEGSPHQLNLVKNKIIDQVLLVIRQTSGSTISIRNLSRYIPDPAAYEYYLKGIYLYDHMKSSEDLEMARNFYTESIKIDSNFIAPLIKLGQTYFVEGNYVEARKHYENALSAAAENRYLSEEADALISIGTIQRIQGEADEALDKFLRAYRISRELKDRQGECSGLRNIGIIYEERGQYDEALKNFSASLEISRDLKDKKSESISLNSMAIVYHNRGDNDNALLYWKKSLELRKEVGNLRGAAIVLSNMSALYQSRGEFDKILECSTEALKIIEDIGDKSGIASQLDALGNLYFVYGNFNKSLDYLNSSLKLLKEMQDQSAEGYTLHNLANVHFESGNYDISQENYSRSIKIFKQLKDTRMEANVRASMGISNYLRSDYIGACKNLSLSVDLFRELNTRNDLLKPLSYLLLCRFQIGDTEKIKTELKILLDNISATDQNSIEYVIYWNIAQTYNLLKENQSRRFYLEKAYKMLMDRADNIGSEADRNRFLSKITVNRQILKAWGENK